MWRTRRDLPETLRFWDVVQNGESVVEEKGHAENTEFALGT